MDYIEAIIVKYLKGTITDAEHKTLSGWLAASKENRREFDRLRETWLATAQSGEVFNFDAEKAFVRFRQKVRHTRKRHHSRHFVEARGGGGKQNVSIRLYRFTIAAAVALVIGVAAVMRALSIPDAPTQAPVTSAFQELTVPYGARSRLMLPDSSTVLLNAGSTLRYKADYGQNNRDLWLTGEGFFEVSKAATPFVVHSGTVSVKALGTKFNVRAYPEDRYVATTLVEGKLEVTDAKKNNPSDAPQTIMMTPNHKLTIALDETAAPTSGAQPQATVAKTPNSKLQTPQSVDLAPEISWKDNEWVIYRERLDQLALKLERRYDIKITFKDEKLKTFRFNGTLPDESLEQVLKLISIVSPIRYSVKGKTVVFSAENSQPHQLTLKTKNMSP